MSTVVTGAARGIGAAIAHRLATEGPLVLVDVAEEVEGVAAELAAAGAAVRAVRADLTEAEGRRLVVAAVEDLGGGVRGLVNNAGITRDARLVKMTEEDFSAVLEVNLGAAWGLADLLVPLMTGSAAIVNMASRTYLGNFGQFNYTVSKGGLVGLTRALALELAPRIRVNAVAPGPVETEMVRAIPDEIRAKILSLVPASRFADPAEIAELVAFLLDGGRSGCVTGQVVVVDGGRTLR